MREVKDHGLLPDDDEPPDAGAVAAGVTILLFAMTCGFIAGLAFGCATVQGAELDDTSFAARPRIEASAVTRWPVRPGG
jgi:hypothetical protein